jgi:UDP-glucose:glycoprotein glucosyltransferase
MVELACSGSYAFPSESASTEYPEKFFDILNVIITPGVLPASLEKQPSRDIYASATRALQQQGYLADSAALASFDLSLSLHSSTPKLEAFYNFYRDQSVSHNTTTIPDGCLSWVDWYGERICDIKTLLQAWGIAEKEAAQA